MKIRTRARVGFTMIEMLTVIAIIAILAAILFPVFAQVRKSVRKTQCINNMHQIAQAVSLYQDTWGKYPLALDAVVVPGAGPGGTNFVVSPLYPQFLKSADVLRCPINIYQNGDASLDMRTATAAQLSTPPNKRSPTSGAAVAAKACTGANGQLRGIRTQCLAGETAAAAFFYPRRDSYDGGFDANQIGNGWEIKYNTDWTEVLPSASDNIRQLKYRSPPADTVISWCLNHCDFDANNVPHNQGAVVAFLDGHVKVVAGERFDFNKWQYTPANDGFNWRVHE